MHEGVIRWWVGARILKRTESNVAFLEDIPLKIVGNKYPNSYIELSIFNEHGFLKVLLNKESISFDNGGTSRDNSNEVVTVEVAFLSTLLDLSIGWISH
jgi:hypothetical protein